MLWHYHVDASCRSINWILFCPRRGRSLIPLLNRFNTVGVNTIALLVMDGNRGSW